METGIESLVGKFAVRTKRNKNGDGSFRSTPEKIGKLTEHHIYLNGHLSYALPREDWDDGNWVLWEGNTPKEDQ